ncbi:MAG: hypothetical protein H6932_00175 [Burkholderiaceae bacterium]|nr:hypothetical protein [Burkholderiaceae bacterium]
MGSCDDTDRGCVFSRALLARAAGCDCVTRRALGEREVLECSQPVARTNCSLLRALMRERARFALKLPTGEAPLMHAQVLRLQCGGLLGLQQVLGTGRADVHHLVAEAQARHGSLTALPWDAIVATMRGWQPRRRRPGTPA